MQQTEHTESSKKHGVYRSIYQAILCNKYTRAGLKNQENGAMNQYRSLFVSLSEAGLSDSEWSDLWDQAMTGGLKR
ncbi:hypothetical protein [Pseudomonas phage LUZ7]|uniref:Uncharacterized protein n=1 Tax=Pseudomonas phage LUZ7 TaxID=655097 RepID=C8ZKK9_9CAUD|nr:hypothetical protein PP-LUZ7_gp110 [Pseudomonas phage LUZ7]CAZ66251.1 hypothetical protein [Pseudomonas phage LUZ7]